MVKIYEEKDIEEDTQIAHKHEKMLLGKFMLKQKIS